MNNLQLIIKNFTLFAFHYIEIKASLVPTPFIARVVEMNGPTFRCDISRERKGGNEMNMDGSSTIAILLYLNGPLAP